LPKVSVVVPVYFNEGSLTLLHQRLALVAANNLRYQFEFIFVDDGSGDNSFKVLENIASGDSRVRVIKLVRNHGSTLAIMAGLSQAKGDAAAVISADLQDPPEMINEMITHWEKGTKMVLAARSSRDDPFTTQFTGNLFNSLFRKLVFKNYPLRGFDCFLIDRQVINIVNQCREKNTHLPGLLMWIGYDYEIIYYDRQRREHGKSRWNFRRKVKYFLDAFTAFSFLPIRICAVLGILSAIFGFLYAVLIILLSLFGVITISGWSSLMVVVLIIGGVQLAMLGLIGEYLWRNFDQTRSRPLFLIDQIIQKFVESEVAGEELKLQEIKPR
jgi:dolichol-phosphate mannosyltransferase